MNKGLRKLGALFVILPAAMCGSGETGADGFVVRDSLGIEILESTSAAWQEGDEWELSAEPLLEVGVTDGDSLYLFYSIVGVHRSSDGSVVVANAGTAEIRFYDAEGRFLNSVGRRGEGPGEYGSIGRVDFLGDSIFVSDYRNVRLSVLASDGTFVRSVNLSAFGLAPPRPLGLFASGSILVWASVVEDLVLVAGVNAEYVEYHRVDPTGTSVESVGRFFGGEYYVEDDGGGSSARMPFGRRSAAAVAGETFYYSDGSNIAITQYSESGVALRIVRHPMTTAPATSEDLDRVVDRFLSPLDEDRRRRFRSTYRAMPLPSAMPAVGALLVGSEGDLWVGEYRSAFEASARCWWIFAARGQLLGSKCLPEGFTLHQVGSDFVLGVSVDELGIERVTIYGLVK